MYTHLLLVLFLLPWHGPSIGKAEMLSPIDITMQVMQRIYGARQSNEKADDLQANLTGFEKQPQVQTTSGMIHGVNNSYSHSFYSIPFAKPPIGELRFRPPQKLETPNITRSLSTKKLVHCAQPLENDQEDCLVLSVHVPAFVDLSNASSPPSDRLPVLFFIHGGAFFFGTETFEVYEGRYLSDVTNTIVITTNYRLGPLGFLVFDDGENSFEGNQGLKDQQLALQWVQDNIENFGGDKNMVTIFGESAGAQSVMFHLISEKSDPLFHGAIMESNPAIYSYPSIEEAQELTNKVVHTLRCGTLGAGINCCNRLTTDYTCLMEAPIENLIAAMIKIMARAPDSLTAIEPFRPYIDGVEFTKQPLIHFKDSSWNNHKPVIIGTNQEEFVPLKYVFPFNEKLFRQTNDVVFNKVQEGMGRKISDKYIETYPDIEDFGLLFGIELTDIIFGCPSRALARFASATTDSSLYYYLFAHVLDGEDCRDYYGLLCNYSFHGSEMVFIFRTIDYVGMIPDEEDVSVSNQFSSYWGNFAWSGYPSDERDFGLEGHFPEWISYKNTTSGNHGPWTNLRFTAPNAHLETDYLGDICDFWDSLGLYPAPIIDVQYSSTVSKTVTNQTHHSSSTTGYSSFSTAGHSTSTTGGGERDSPVFVHFLMCLLVATFTGQL